MSQKLCSQSTSRKKKIFFFKVVKFNFNPFLLLQTINYAFQGRKIEASRILNISKLTFKWCWFALCAIQPFLLKIILLMLILCSKELQFWQCHPIKYSNFMHIEFKGLFKSWSMMISSKIFINIHLMQIGLTFSLLPPPP